MESIPNSDFIDIDERVLDLVKNNITNYIKENCPRIDIYTCEDNWIGLRKTGIRINGFDYNYGGANRHSHPQEEIKWLKRVRISELRDEWFLVAFSCGDYVIYFKCDQLEGLMKLLEDYKICEWKMVRESVDVDKEELEDYFVSFEDLGGNVVIERGGRHASSYLRVTSKKNNLTQNDIFVVTIFTNEKHIKGKINWK
mgnify:CR=1 FL=1